VTRALARACAVWLAFTAPARAAEYDFGDWKLDLAGSLRELVTSTRELDVHDAFPGFTGSFSLGNSPSLLATTRARVDFQARYGEHWSGQLVYDHELFLGSGRRALGFRVAEKLGAPTWLDLDRTLVDSGDATWRHLLYRGWLRYETDSFEVTLGRQRIALGRGRLWNPSDVFNPIPPLAIEADQRIGVDAALARAHLPAGFGLSAIVAPERNLSGYRTRSALRLELSRRQLDAALMVARLGPDSLLGADFALDLAGAGLRGEATETWRDDGSHFPQVVGSVDYTFPLGESLYVLVEHFYNGNLIRRDSLAKELLALPKDALQRITPNEGVASLASRIEPLSTSRLATVSRNLTGVELGYDLTPLLRADVLWIHDWLGPSEAVFPSVTWSVRSDLEISAGVQLFSGAGGGGEYGGLPPLYFLRLDAYF
jgi:hypothetical protein